MYEAIINNPLFSLSLILFSYSFGTFLQKKSGKSWLNPLLISVILIIAIMLIFNIPLSAFNNGGDIVNSAHIVGSIYKFFDFCFQAFVFIQYFGYLFIRNHICKSV